MISEKTRQSRKAILDQIEGVSQNCKGCKLKRSDTDRYCLSNCSVGAEIKTLGDELFKIKNRGKLILAKGDEMTKSEVAYLVKIGTPRIKIKQATGTMLALIHSEVSEALEADRKGDVENFKEELADVCIRIFDLCGLKGIDLEKAITKKMDYNKSRTYKHGGKAY
jgi:NTP pyrophosphatase (non-canonical NTP hydrolase)